VSTFLASLGEHGVNGRDVEPMPSKFMIDREPGLERLQVAGRGATIEAAGNEMLIDAVPGCFPIWIR
jgi:hypothetical protein